MPAASSSDPVILAADLCRDRGRVVVMGAVGMELPRPPFYEKELSFCVSRSYGPGRYDPLYEEAGVDYPAGYVRWTENRNLRAFLGLVGERKVRVAPLVSHRIPIAEGERAYRVVAGEEPSLGVLLTYPEGPEPVADRPARRVDRSAAAATEGPGAQTGLGLLGAGAFATGTLLPAIQAVGGFRLVGLATATGASSHRAAEKFGFFRHHGRARGVRRPRRGSRRRAHPARSARATGGRGAGGGEARVLREAARSERDGAGGAHDRARARTRPPAGRRL